MGDVVSLAERRAAREPKADAVERDPAAQGLMLVRLPYTPGMARRIGREPRIGLMLDERRGFVLTAQDALDIATALIAAVKGGPHHVA